MISSCEARERFSNTSRKLIISKLETKIEEGIKKAAIKNEMRFKIKYDFYEEVIILKENGYKLTPDISSYESFKENMARKLSNYVYFD